MEYEKSSLASGIRYYLDNDPRCCHKRLLSIVCLRMGIFGEKMTNAEIGKVFNISGTRVQQITHTVIRKISYCAINSLRRKLKD